MTGRRIGPYELGEKLGEGGMGEVYKAIDTSLGRPVAIKFLIAQLARDPELQKRFQAEARAQANLHHTNLAIIYSYLMVDDAAGIVMEFIEGETLSSMIARRGPIPEQEAIPLFRQALLGVGYAHRMGIIHRDLKPSNIMVDRYGIVKVMDFGIAKVLGTQGLTRTGTHVGTAYYAPPEQILNSNVDIRSDIYALGISLYEMLTGRVPFIGDSEFAILSQHLHNAPPPPRSIYPYLHPGLERIVLKAIEKNPDLRFQTTEEFGAALEHPEQWAMAGAVLPGAFVPPGPQTVPFHAAPTAYAGAPPVTPPPYGVAAVPIPYGTPAPAPYMPGPHGTSNPGAVAPVYSGPAYGTVLQPGIQSAVAPAYSNSAAPPATRSPFLKLMSSRTGKSIAGGLLAVVLVLGYFVFRPVAHSPISGPIKGVGGGVSFTAEQRTAASGLAPAQPGTKPASPPQQTQQTEQKSAAPPPAAASQQVAKVEPPKREVAAPPAAAAPAIAVPSMVVPATTQIAIRMIDSIDSRDAAPGATFSASVSEPVTVDGRLAISRGSQAEVKVVNAANAGHIKGQSVLALRLVRISLHGRTYPVVSSVFEKEGGSRGKLSSEVIGGAAAAGAVLGSVFHHKHAAAGAAEGGAAGAGAGAGYQMLTPPKPVVIGSEDVITFALKQPLVLNPE